MTHAATFVYVSDASNHKIVVYAFDNASGKLREVEAFEVNAAPGSLAVSPDRKFLYASLRSTSELASYALGAEGKLTPISKISLEPMANATYVATDRTGKFLLTASYHAGQVAVYGIDAEGKLKEEALQTIETTKTAHAAVISADNQWLFVPHVAPNAIFQFRFDASAGKLTLEGKAAGGKAEAGPRHLALHPSQNWAFSSDETGNSITLYALDAQTGLKPLKNLSTLPGQFTGMNTTADVKLHPTGEFVWVSNRGHDSLAGFRFDAKAGKLTPLGQSQTEKTPRSFDLAPSGNWLFAAGEGSGNLAIYKVNSGSGKLQRTGTHCIGQSLTWVMAVELK